MRYRNNDFAVCDRKIMEIFLSRTQGFCAGVAYAVAIVEKALAKYGSPVYVFHEIVHNTFVVEDFRRRGVVFVEDLNAIPFGERVIFSAHGVPPAIAEQAKSRNLTIIDATCPLVKKVHLEARKFSARGCHVVLIGHRKHQEVIGTAGYIHPDFLHFVETPEDIEKLVIPADAPVTYLSQTTLSVDETRETIKRLREKIPGLQGPGREDICYATQRRQDAVKELAAKVELIIVCGSPSSSNSNRLKETAQKTGTPTVIVDSADDLDLQLLQGKNRIGVSSGASVPRRIVDEVLNKIKGAYPQTVIHDQPSEEKAFFPLPDV